jgi:hypothetical protein
LDLVGGQAGAGLAPGGRRDAGFFGEVIEEGGGIGDLAPDLREESGGMVTEMEYDAVEVKTERGEDGFGRAGVEGLERGEDADFDFELVEVDGLNGLEPGIVEGGGAGIFCDGEVEGLERGEVSDATSELVVMGEGDEACVV